MTGPTSSTVRRWKSGRTSEGPPPNLPLCRGDLPDPTGTPRLTGPAANNIRGIGKSTFIRDSRNPRRGLVRPPDPSTVGPLLPPKRRRGGIKVQRKRGSSPAGPATRVPGPTGWSSRAESSRAAGVAEGRVHTCPHPPRWSLPRRHSQGRARTSAAEPPETPSPPGTLPGPSAVPAPLPARPQVVGPRPCARGPARPPPGSPRPGRQARAGDGRRPAPRPSRRTSRRAEALLQVPAKNFVGITRLPCHPK